MRVLMLTILTFSLLTRQVALYLFLALALVSCGDSGSGSESKRVNELHSTTPPTITFHIAQDIQELTADDSPAQQMLLAEAVLYLRTVDTLKLNGDDFCRASLDSGTTIVARNKVKRNSTLQILPGVPLDGEIFSWIDFKSWKDHKGNTLGALMADGYVLCIFRKTGELSYSSSLTLTSGNTHYRANLKSDKVSPLYTGIFIAAK